MDDPVVLGGSPEQTPTKAIAPERQRVLLPRLFEALTSTDGYAEGLRRLGEELKPVPLAQSLRFYYEEILGRSPETAAFAHSTVVSPEAELYRFLRSNEFMECHDITIQRLYPHIIREFFIHIPKAGGTTVFEAFSADTRFCPLVKFPGDQNGYFTDRLLYLQQTINRLRHPDIESFFTFGYFPASRIIKNGLKRGWDSVIMVFRDPIDTAISWINYVLMNLLRNPTRPDVILWRRRLDVPEDRVLSDPGTALEFAQKIAERIVPQDVICNALGQDRRLWSALETAHILDLKIVRLPKMDSYIQSRGIKAYRNLNISDKLVNLDDLDKRTQTVLYDKNSEDLKFWDWIQRNKRSQSGQVSIW